MFCGLGLVACRWRQLTSNVRRRKYRIPIASIAMLTLPLNLPRSVGSVRFAQPALAGSQSFGRAGYGARRFGRNRQIQIQGNRAFGVGSCVVSDVCAGAGGRQVVSCKGYSKAGRFVRGTARAVSHAYFSESLRSSSYIRLPGFLFQRRFSGASLRLRSQAVGLSLQPGSTIRLRIRPGRTPASSNPSVKLSTNGVAHWPSGAGASPHFAPAVQCATPSVPAYLER
jgi:hypothetical protein